MYSKEEIDAMLSEITLRGNETLEELNSIIARIIPRLKVLKLEQSAIRSEIQYLKYLIKLSIRDKKVELKKQGLSKTELNEQLGDYELGLDEYKNMMEKENYNRYISAAIDVLEKQIELLKTSCTNLQSLNKLRFIR